MNTTKSTIRVDRLTILADFLDRLGPEDFDIRSYCGCAIGACLRIPELKDGWSWNANRFPIYKSRIGSLAAADFFGIDFEVAANFFQGDSYGSGGYTTASQVSGRIRQFIAENKTDEIFPNH